MDTQLMEFVKEHVLRAKRANTHPAKLVVLSNFLNRVFQIKIEELLPGIESKLGSKILGVKGSADLIFSNVVFEIKVDLEEELDDACQKLIKYLQAIYEAEPNRKHIGVATDAVKFIAYSPVVKNGKVTNLKNISELDLEKSSFDEAVLWLDSFFFSKVAKPTADDIKWRFGPHSPSYTLSIEELETMWEAVEQNKDVKLRLDLWAKHMEMVYGSKPDRKAFIDQTYLVTLIKLILYLKLSEIQRVKKEDIERVITGEFFIGQGVLNLIEEDFFTWLVLYPKTKENAIDLACSLTRELLRYDMTAIDEDLFKDIYQEIISRSERHKVGEYYTPEWLCELTLREALGEWKRKHKGIPRILDPACGSGTFLTNAIRLLMEELKTQGVQSSEAAEVILKNVVGIDINPLAVVIARANYILMFGDNRPSFHVTIPVYIADSVKLPSEAVPEEKGIRIPMKISSDRALLGQVLEGMRQALDSYKRRKLKKAAFETFKMWASKIPPDQLEVLSSTLETLMELTDRGEDSIWIFWLNNMYAPLALKKSQFDLVVGNPPWVEMRYFENKEYQDFLKKSVLDYELLDSKDVKLFTHIDIATLFFRKVGDLYLKEGGIIGFVMPRSILTGALQHVRFKSFNKPVMRLTKILDLEEVLPLFNVPSCVLICAKGEETSYPVLASKYAGILNKKNEKLLEAQKILKFSKYDYKPPIPKVEEFSPYYSEVLEGATIVPRAFWFVEFDVPPTGWVNVKAPAVKTDSNIEKKPPWTDVKLGDNVESNFIYVTLLSGDIVRFGYRELRPVIIPVEPTNEGYRMLDVDELVDRGFIGITGWLEGAQKIWEKKATERSKKDFPRVVSWLNYRNKLNDQNPRAEYIVLYNDSGTNLASCVVNKRALPLFEIGKSTLKPMGFIAEHGSYFHETDDDKEAHYLCAVLNSNKINEAIKPLQPKGLFGERNISRRPFMFPIPLFDRNNSDHMKLAELSKLCHAKMSQLSLKGERSASARRRATEIVEKELKEIDNLVSKMF